MNGINSRSVRGQCVRSSQFADVCEVDEGGFLGSDSDHLRGLHHKLPLLSSHHVRVLLPHDVEDSVQKLRQEAAQRVMSTVVNADRVHITKT